MADVLDGDKRERIQALSLAKECYTMKIDLKFVDRNRDRGFMPQNGKVVIDNDTAEPIENT